MLYTHLKTLGKRYQKRGNTSQIVDRVPIEQRPKIVERKKRLGDLEIDLITGKDHKGTLFTINNRATGKLKIAH